jgi:tetratricopeptide (TPR) repeat protein
MSNSISRFGLLIALCLLPVSLLCDAAQYVQWGTQMLQQHKYEDAAKYFNGALKADQHNASAWKGMGYALVGEGQKEKALPYLKYSAKLNPSDTALQSYISSLGGTAATAQAAPQPAAAGNPASEAAYAKGIQYMQTRKFPYAAYYFNQATVLDPSNAKGWQGLGTAFYAQGAKDKAIAAWDKAIALDPGNTQLAQYVATLKSSEAPAPSQAMASAAPANNGAPAESQSKLKPINPWVMGTTVAALGAIMLFVF